MAYRMCTHVYAVDVGNFSLPTSQYSIHEIVGLQQAAITKQEQLWNTECGHMLRQETWETFLSQPLNIQ